MHQLRISLSLFLLLTVLTGIAYPLAVLGTGQTLFPWQANGSLIEKDGKAVGSALIGQKFTSPRYFHGRPSAAGEGYDAARSGASNLAPSSLLLKGAVQKRVTALRDEGFAGPVPPDLVTASGSGLDPHISVTAAMAQIGRVAKARHLPAAEVEKLIDEATEPRTFGILGEARINVLRLNLALDALSAAPSNP